MIVTSQTTKETYEQIKAYKPKHIVKDNFQSLIELIETSPAIKEAAQDNNGLLLRVKTIQGGGQIGIDEEGFYFSSKRYGILSGAKKNTYRKDTFIEDFLAHSFNKKLVAKRIKKGILQTLQPYYDYATQTNTY